jgi:glycosyltransferase involved in cell wall biosynthesis
VSNEPTAPTAPTAAPLRVGFDATSLLGHRTGVGHVAAGMLTAVNARPDLELHAFAVTWRGRDGLSELVPPSVTAHDRAMPARAARLSWRTFGRPRAEWWTSRVDVVHAPNFVAPPSRAPSIVTVHDLTFVRFPELCTSDTLRYRAHIERALQAGATIHAVSDFVADEVREVFGVSQARVRRIYAGVESMAAGTPTRGRRLATSGRYVLALGTIEPRKNLVRLVEAFDQVAHDDPELALVLAGSDGWGSDALDAAIAAARHGDRVRRLGYVEARDRCDLLAGASVLAYPSLYEGFGHPPLEAMSVDVPVVASNAGALPEVLGDAALLPDALDVDAIAEALARVLGDEQLRSELTERGRARVAGYRWTDTGSELDALYRDVAS